MHLLLVTGFLGSGKTTLIIKLAHEIIQRGKKAAILVNEIGEIGIDDQVMRQLDLNVWELVNGCICCTLSADLITTLQTLDQEYQVDLVLVEPSGAAEPGNILRALPYYKGRPLESIRSVSLIDPLRITELFEVLTPLITNQISKSELVLINKADLASEEELGNARQIAKQINPEGKVLTITANKPLDPGIIEEILP